MKKRAQLGSRAARRRVRIGSLALLAYGLFYLAFFARAFVAPSTRFIGICESPCDAIQFIWGISWVGHALLQGHNPFVTSAIGWPARTNGMWQTWTIGWGILLAPLKPFLPPVFLYNVAVFLTCLLNSFSTYLLLRSVKCGYLGSFLGGLIFGLSPYFQFHLEGHLNLVSFFPINFAALCLLNILKRRGPYLFGVLCGLWLFLELLMSEEILATSLLVAVVVAAASLALKPDLSKRLLTASTIKALLLCGFVFVFLGAYPLYVQLFGPNAIHGSLHGEVLTRAAGMFKPTGALLGDLDPNAALFGTSRLGDNDAAYLSLFSLLLMAIAVVVLRADPLSRIAALTAGAVLLLSLGSRLSWQGAKGGIYLPWYVLSKLPVFNQVIPARLAVYVYLFLAYFVAALGRRLARLPAPGAAALTALIVLSCLFQLNASYSVPYTYAELPQPKVFTNPGLLSKVVPRGSAVMFAPLPRDGKYDVAPMLWQADADFSFSLMGGYTIAPSPTGKGETTPGGWPPTGLVLALDQIETRGAPPVVGTPPPPKELRHQALKQLKEERIGVVAVGPSPVEREEVSYLEAVLKQRPVEVSGVYFFRIKP